jgi:hypothetical protein
MNFRIISALVMRHLFLYSRTPMRLVELVPQGAPEGLAVDAVPHPVAFDPDRKLWYCDIDLDPGTAYQPFVRLALSRYQPHSIDGCHISRVVRADFAQLLPARVATVMPMVGGRTTITLRGPSGSGGGGFRLIPPDPQRFSLTRDVTATVQRLAPGDDPDLGWVDTGAPIELTVATDSGDHADVAWSAVLPAVNRQEGWRYRILLQEFEIHPTDPGSPEEAFGGVRTLHYWVKEFPQTGNARRRLVYADTFKF